MRINRMHLHTMAMLWALGAGCLLGLRPSHALSEVVTPDSGANSLHNVDLPGLDPDQFALSDDFTIRYTITDRDIRPMEVRVAGVKGNEQLLLREYLKDANHGLPPPPGQAVPPEIRKRAEEDAKRLLDTTGRPMTVTLSEHGGNFLCQRMTNQPDPNTAAKGDMSWSDIVLFDGRQSFHHIFEPRPTDDSVLENNFLWDGFDGAELSAMPVFCSRTAVFPLIRSLIPVGDGVYQGDVLDPGNSGDHGISLYDPKTLVHVAYAAGKPRITQIVRQDPDGTVSRHMEITDWALFQGVWIPAKASYTFTSFTTEGKRVPSHVVAWSLLDAKATADARPFDRSTYLHAGDRVVFMSKPTVVGQFDLTFNPVGGSLDQQRQAAQEAQRQLAARLPQFSKQMKADTTNHGHGEEAGLLLRAAEMRAAASDRKVFLVFHASWCGSCFMLHRFLTDPQVKPVLDAHFVVQDLDIWERQKNGWENPGGAALDKKYGGPNSIPFFAVLNASGSKEGDSMHGGENMGMPTQPEDVAIFLHLLKAAAPGLTEAELRTLKAGLARSAIL